MRVSSWQLHFFTFTTNSILALSPVPTEMQGADDYGEDDYGAHGGDDQDPALIHGTKAFAASSSRALTSKFRGACATRPSAFIEMLPLCCSYREEK